MTKAGTREIANLRFNDATCRSFGLQRCSARDEFRRPLLTQFAPDNATQPPPAASILVRPPTPDMTRAPEPIKARNHLNFGSTAPGEDGGLDVLASTPPSDAPRGKRGPFHVVFLAVPIPREAGGDQPSRMATFGAMATTLGPPRSPGCR
jgi:hypothetical protein